MKRIITLALVVAAMMSASVSASAQGRKGELVKVRKGDIRKEIRFHRACCPAMAIDQRFIRFDRRFDKRFARPVKFVKHRKHACHDMLRRY